MTVGNALRFVWDGMFRGSYRRRFLVSWCVGVVSGVVMLLGASLQMTPLTVLVMSVGVPIFLTAWAVGVYSWFRSAPLFMRALAAIIFVGMVASAFVTDCAP